MHSPRFTFKLHLFLFDIRNKIRTTVTDVSIRIDEWKEYGEIFCSGISNENEI